MPDGIDEADRLAKKELINFIKSRFVTTTWAGRGNGHANVLPVWHGAAEDTLRSIAKNGFASLVDFEADDPGVTVLQVVSNVNIADT